MKGCYAALPRALVGNMDEKQAKTLLSLCKRAVGTKEEGCVGHVQREEAGNLTHFLLDFCLII